jgi:hypothetical protein
MRYYLDLRAQYNHRRKPAAIHDFVRSVFPSALKLQAKVEGDLAGR